MKNLFSVKRTTIKKDFIESLIIGVLCTGLSYIIALVVGWIDKLSILEILAVFTSYSCTYLCVKERRLNYPIGAISTALYAILFMQSGLISSAILNAYLTPALIYGWFRWRKDSNTRPVTHVATKMIPVYLLIVVIGYTGASLISQSLGGTMAWADSLILAGSILAQFLLDNKKIENWAVWAIVNVLAIYIYATTGLWLVAFQYVLFLLNTVYGFIVWQNSKKSTEQIEVPQ